MIGADKWILKPVGQPFISNYWWESVWRMPLRYPVHLYERLTQGVSRYDAINLKGFIADAVAMGAWKLFAHHKSYPMDMTEDQWAETLLEIYDGFTEDPDVDGWRPPDEAWRLLQTHFRDLWS